MSNTDFDFTGDPSSAALAETFRKTTPQKISTREEAARLSPGTTFVGPDEKEHVVPYKVERPEQIANIPDGADFIGPDGVLRQKPKYEGIDFTAQTLYDMGVNDKERRKALERSYPGKVKDDPAGGFFVEDDGVLRKPGRGVSRYTGGVAAAAAPTGLSILGALGGGAAGSVEPGAGTFIGGTLGGAGGAILGQSFNDMIMGLAGTYDRSPTEQAAETGMAGLSGMAGAGVGRGVATVVPSLKAGVSAAGAALPGIARSVAGIKTAEQQANLTMAREMAEKGVLVPPSATMPELPHVQNLVEVFDPAFHTNKPLLESATAHYEKSAGEILQSLGVKDPGTLTKPIADVPTKEAGEAIMRRTLGELAEKDAQMQAALDARKAALTAGQPEAAAQRESIQRAADEARGAAQAVIDAGYKDIDNDIKTAMRVAEAGHNSGDLWGMVGQKLVATRQAVGARAKKMYDAADQAAGGHLPNIEGLPEQADAFLKQLPPDFQSKYPDIVRKLRDLGGVRDEKTGEWIKEPHQPTFGELHDLRSQFRSNVNYNDLTPGLRDGAYKFFAHKVDAILHDPEAVPALQEASQLLRKADAFYAENIKIFNAQQVKAVMRGLESGEPADPQNLYNVVVRSGQTDLTNRIKAMVGPNLWAGVRGADMQAMLDGAKTLQPGVIDGRSFSRQVLDRVRDGTLEIVHGKEASDKLIEQARRIEMLEGRLDIPVRPGDTMTQVIARARQAEEVAKATAKADPLKTLNSEMQKIEKERQGTMAKAMRGYRNDPLKFLYDPSTGATHAVDKILGSEDLILASAARFGEKSPEFEMIRQIYTQRLLRETLQPSEKLAGVSPEIQQLMFPGVTLNQMRVLAKEMDFLMKTRAGRGGDTAGGMAAMARVEHPWGSNIFGKAFQTGAKMVSGPFADAGMRSALGSYYAFVRKLATSPATLRWLEKGLSGSPEQRNQVRQQIQAVLQKGSAAGAGAGEAAYQGAGPQ